MFNMIFRIAKRLHINQTVLWCLSLFGHSYVSCDDNAVRKAREILNSITPHGNSLNSSPLHQNHEYQLQIIVPVYNSEQYIGKCIDSALSSCRRHRMIITIINDGSTDNSGKILKRYENNPKVEVINQENRGHSGARNRGLDQIRGRYITFLNSDDELIPDALDMLLDTAMSKETDILEGSYEIFYNGHNAVKKFIHVDEKCVSTDKLYGFPWGKIIKSSLFEKVKFPEGYWFEDTIMRFLIYPLSKSSYTSSTLLYRYRRNPKGITATAKSSPKVIDSFYITEQLLKDRISLGLKNDADLQPVILRQIRINYLRIASYGNEEINKHTFVLTVNMYKHYFNTYNNVPHSWRPLDKALRTNDYKAYKLACQLC